MVGKIGQNYQMGVKLGENASRIRGRVKWFDPVKGYGFIKVEPEGPDVLIHLNTLRNFGQSSVAENSEIEAMAQRAERGVQAVEVLSITPPETPLLGENYPGIDREELNQIPVEAARVKWFDRSKGFGFANVFGKRGDVFIHIEVLHRSGMADPMAGEAIGLRVQMGDRGATAMEVLTWENASLLIEKKGD